MYMPNNIEQTKCVECGSYSVKAGFHMTRNGRVQRFQCRTCGRIFLETKASTEMK